MASRACCPLVMRILAASVNVAKRSGGVIRDVLSSGNLGIVEKGRNDLQTEADRAAQRCIVASLHKQFPKVAIFGEEELDPHENIRPEWIETSLSEDVLGHECPHQYRPAKEEELVIWVDPLDGTAEYTQGLLDHVTVLIGLSYKGKAIGGVIHQPYYNYKSPDADVELGRTVWGLIGLGSFGHDARRPPDGENIVTTTRSHSNRAVIDSVRACNPTEVIQVGGAGHKVLLLLDGKVHAYVFASPGCKKWDTCAPEAILHAAGGRLTDIHGSSLEYHHGVQRLNSGGVLATLYVEHDAYVQCMPESVKAVLIP